MQTLQYQGLKVIAETNHLLEDNLVVEAPLQININQESYTVVMRTPGNDFQLITGLLFAEDIYKKNTPISFDIVKKENNINAIINVTISKNDLGKGYLNKRTLLSVSSCGICGKKELNHLKVEGKYLNNKQQFNLLEVSKMMEAMRKNQKVFEKTGGLHAASIFNHQKELLTVKEDIGRHNAVDKVIGDLLTTDALQEAKYLVVSGRVSYEIVTKAFIAKIPVIIAVSACSSLAVDFAKEFGICLVGFTRDDKMTIYSNPEYFKNIQYV